MPVFRGITEWYLNRKDKPPKDEMLAAMIAEGQSFSKRTYGYRRIHMWLKRKKQYDCNPKTVLRVMRKYGLLSEIRRRKKYRYMGEQVHRYENLLNRNFGTDRPNAKWVTDISYIQTRQGVLYLSIVRDLYDNSIVAYRTGTEQTANLVLETIKERCIKKRSPQSCSSTATKDFSTHQKHTIT